MKVALFYNKENVGDVLIMKSNDEIATSFKKFNDLVAIYRNDTLIGYNLFDISSKFNDLKNLRLKVLFFFLQSLFELQEGWCMKNNK